jgi:16S rRNA (guanine966-N2)-methyltransferase
MASRGAPAPARAGAKRPARAATLPREVRIIGGQWKRTKLAVLDKPGLRPTPDRVRETLFNWLEHDLTGWRCVDAFAGTGALGLEAASRGAAQVLLVEQDPELVARLRAVQGKLGATAVTVQRANGLSVLAQLPPASVDLVFLDPPFEADVYDKALAGAASVVRPEGLVYLEAPHEWQDPALERHGLVRLRHLRAGAVHAHLLQRTA